MSGALNAGIAFAAGVASFVSPCILPLIPAYLSLMGGSAGAAAATTRGAAQPAGAADAQPRPAPRRWTAVRNTLFFVAGFAVVFVALGVLFSSAFGLLGGAQIVNIVAGALIVLLGINFVFDFIGFLNFERRLHTSARPAGAASSLLFGMAFGAGWTPCIGPILSSILLLAGTSGSIAQGAALLLVYSAGLGLPFILASLFLSSALAQLARVRRYMRAIKLVSGLFLIGIGLLVLLGRLRGFNGLLFGLSSALSQWASGHVLLARLVFGGALLALAALVAAFYLRALARDRRLDAPPAAPAGATRRPVRGIRPVRLALFVILGTLGVLALAGAINLPSVVASWLNYQGI